LKTHPGALEAISEAVEVGHDLQSHRESTWGRGG
jgi:hypothetical protein